MGCSSSTQKRSTILNPQTRYHTEVEKRLLPLIDINHQANVNNKYIHISKILPDQFTNKGIHRTNAYISLVNFEDLEAKRKEFWGILTRNKD